jgi:hypothetical protein
MAILNEYCERCKEFQNHELIKSNEYEKIDGKHTYKVWIVKIKCEKCKKITSKELDYRPC